MQPGTIRGVISVNTKGFGFVTQDDRSAFVPPPLLNRLLQDDVVDAAFEEAGDKRTVTRVTLLERPRTELCGRVLTRAGKRFLKVDRAIANTDWPLDARTPEGAEAADGVFVVAAIAREANVDVARLLRVVPEEQTEIEGLLVRFRLFGDPSAAVLAAASSAPAIDDVIAAEVSRRRDLRSLVVVTIDGPSTKDIDDALACLPADADGALRVIVAIADVDALVSAGSVLDDDARARGTSVYLPDRVIPMLPRSLSEDRLSLIEGADRLCLCAELRVDVDGVVTAVDVQEGVMRSTARLTYDGVRDFLDRGDASAVPSSTHETLRRLRAVGARLGVQRAARGGVAVDRGEAKLAFDPSGNPIGVTELESTSAHLLVERLMVAANEAVARFLVDRGLPGLFRVHDAPDVEHTRTLSQAARGLGIEAAFSSTTALSPLGLAAFDAQISKTSIEPAARALLRRLLGPARYQPQPGQHFGLAAPLYLHFTSPIRRYADLVVHRILKQYLRGHRDFAVDVAALPLIAAGVDSAAARSAKAENERTRSLVARAFASRIGERVSGRVIGHKPFGALVQLPGILALLPDAADLPLGSAVEAVVVAVDTVLGRVDLKRA
ncbi:MAG: ribonuclease R [Deltaproteobacteria bacterium]|nr:ribonuclease R [Deltaproteobacteria bacterium]